MTNANSTPPGINETHDPNLKSWVESANEPGTEFPIQNLPWCIIGREDEDWDGAKLGVRIGDSVLDLMGTYTVAVRAHRIAELHAVGLKDDFDFAFRLETLTSAQRSGLRSWLSRLL